jgi:hypothetical protein
MGPESEWFIQFTWLKVEEAKDEGEKLLKCRVCVNGKKTTSSQLGSPGQSQKRMIL